MGFASRGRLQKTVYSGSDCSGVDGAVNRTLTHTKPLLSDSLIVIGRSTLIPVEDYSVAGNVITFTLNVDNTDKILVIA
jgi:hypothetical protein